VIDLFLCDGKGGLKRQVENSEKEIQNEDGGK
jgi:hypothetical protein